MRKLLLMIAVLGCVIVGRAQDAVYLLGTDGQMDADHASATLKKNDKGAFVGEVTFQEKRFRIATKLVEDDRWDTVKDYWYGYMMDDDMRGVIIVGQSKTIWGVNAYEDEKLAEIMIYEGFELMEKPMDGGGIDFSQPLWVKVAFDDANHGQITIYAEKTDDPDYEGGGDDPEEDDGTTPAPDIDLTTGIHFTITLDEPNTLKQRLEEEVAQTDYNIVDFLTVKGKLGGKDLAYLRAQEELVSQLKYLDLSDIELVFDDEAYYSTTVNIDGSSNGMQEYRTFIYTLSAENEDEEGEGRWTGVYSYYTTYCHRNDLSYAFCDMKYLQQVKLPKTLPGLGAGIFYRCEKLDKVTFPSAATYIGDNAFVNTTEGYNSELRRTLKGVDLPQSIDSLGVNAMRGVGFRTIDLSNISKLGEGCLTETNITEVALNSSVTKIPAKAFSGCNRIASVTIPATLEEIGDEAFKGCEKLAHITFTGQVETIGKQAFDGCKKLTAVSINAKHIGESSFAYCNLRSVEVADGAKSIGKFAFNGNRTLTTVTAPNTLEEIGSHAFNGWMEFGVGFYDTPYISNLPAENGVKYIGSVAYLYTGGSKLEVKEGTLGIADDFLKNHKVEVDEYSGSTISGWTAPTTITLPTTLRVIGKQSFLRNTNLTTIELPASLEKIGNRAFANCENLSSITIPANVAFAGGDVFDGSALVYVDYQAIDVEGGFDFPNTLTRAIIGEGVKVIPAGMFAYCTNLTHVQMSSTVEAIGESAFGNCTSLSHIDLPSSLKKIGNYAFSHNGLSSMAVYMTEPIALEPQTFYMSSQIPLLQVPNGSLSAYQGSGAWTAAFQKIEQFDGASSTEAIAETTTVSISQSVTETTDLSGSMVGGIYITLDTEDAGDGYDPEEGCIVINSQTTEAGIAAASADDADDLTVKNQLQGLMFEIPAGKGKITVDCQTLGSRLLFVKIGSDESKKVSQSIRGTVTFNYDVAENTRVYIYAADEVQLTHAIYATSHRAASANDDCVKFFGLSIEVDENLNGIETVNGHTATQPGAIYDLMGRRLTEKPASGYYIQGGKKYLAQ